MQIVCTPLHLLALDTYNTPTASLSERTANVGRLLPDSTGIRMFRFLCAYGIGGVLYRDPVAPLLLSQRFIRCRPRLFTSTCLETAEVESGTRVGD